jgi:hypothetical protein
VTGRNEKESGTTSDTPWESEGRWFASRCATASRRGRRDPLFDAHRSVSVQLALATLGISADDEELREILAAIKARALETKALLPFEEVARIVRERLFSAAPTA